MTEQGLSARPFSARGSTPAGRLVGALLATALLVAAAAFVTRLAGTAALGAFRATDLTELALAAVAVLLAFAAHRFLADGFGPAPRLFASPLLLLAVSAGSAVPVIVGTAPRWVLVVAAGALIGAVVVFARRLATGPGLGETVGTTSPAGVRGVAATEAGTGHLAAAVVVAALGVLLGASAALTWLMQVA
jgi:hypothetical protein